MDKQIFALDIGTRSVTGMLLEKSEKDIAVASFHTEEHQERSMLDGQIHNVMQVAEVIQKVKNKLEAEGHALHKVFAAAAGRSLRTQQASASVSLDEYPLTEQAMVTHLELSAVHQALLRLAAADNLENHADYYCVGYSVLRYRLDGEPIGSLIDQRGTTAETEVIATFLPKIVVESLIAALERAGLEMEALTLEPIAAIRVLIPESMRRLNVALIDIGAGTSDIALTDDGTVTAYGMVPIAGDEITEMISDTYLLDYPQAEMVKRSITEKGRASVQDILGFETEITLEAFAKAIEPAVENLSSSIAAEVLRLNGTAPKAVMLIGGGSLTPGIPERIADKLNLPHNRVAVRGIEAIQHLKFAEGLPTGPDYVTPIGIGIAAEEKPVHYLSVQVNEKTIRMFELKTLTIGDCLIQAGIEPRAFYGKPGLGMLIQVNGVDKIIPGSHGGLPIIQLNGKPAKIDDAVKQGDHIRIESGTDGKAPSVTIRDIVGNMESKTVSLNDKQISIQPIYMVNGQTAAADQLLQDGDALTISMPATVQDLLKEQNEWHGEQNGIHIWADGKEMHFDDQGHVEVIINGQISSLSAELNDGDQIHVKRGPSTKKQPEAWQVLEQLGLDPVESITVFFDGQQIEMKQDRYTVYRDAEEIAYDTPLQDGDQLQIKERNAHVFIYQDIFRYIELDLAHVSGRFELLINGQKAGFDTPIMPGDQLAIHWADS